MPVTTLVNLRGGSHAGAMSTQTLTRHEGLVTSLSWIPTEAIEGAQRLAFDSGITHYDAPPPTEGMDLEALREADRFRFANELRAFITVDDAGTDRRLRVRGWRPHGIDAREPRRGEAPVRRPFQLPDIQREPEHGDGWVRFVQTSGGRTGMPAPRRVRRKPYVQWQAPLVWTTLSLTLHADGRAEHALIGASRVPPALGLRRRQPALAQVGADRLQGLVPQVVRQAQPLGRRGLRGARHRGRVRARELAVGPAHAGRRQGGASTSSPAGTILVQQGEPGTEVLLDPRRDRARRTATASAWPSTGPGRSWASGRTSRAACARRATLR